MPRGIPRDKSGTTKSVQTPENVSDTNIVAQLRRLDEERHLHKAGMLKQLAETYENRIKSAKTSEERREVGAEMDHLIDALLGALSR